MNEWISSSPLSQQIESYRKTTASLSTAVVSGKWIFAKTYTNSVPFLEYISGSNPNPEPKKQKRNLTIDLGLRYYL